MVVSVCPLTGYDLQKAQFPPVVDSSICYVYKPVGKVRIALPTYLEFIHSGNLKRPELAGICRNASEKDEEPPLIDQGFLATGIRNLDFPKTFPEKARHLLLYMYRNGGSNYHDFEFQSALDYPLCYAEDQEEFKRFFNHLEGKGFITIKSPLRIASNIVFFRDVTMTESGISEAEKVLPQIPMVGLINQEISTGDSRIDEQINQARKLFFGQPQSKANMRSACESLSYILEPLRDECEKIFTKPSTNIFFQLVNTFDIRHNKATTNSIEHPEQLEWIFYTLLNTINTYYKLRMKLS